MDTPQRSKRLAELNVSAEQQKILTARLSYAARGWSTFPAPADGSKKSLKWEQRHGTRWGQTKDVEVIRKEFKSKRFKVQNIGIATGYNSGIFVIECDTAEHGKNIDGAAALKRWEAEHGKLPKTLMAKSPSGSIHRYFQHPGEGIKVKSFNAILGARLRCRLQGRPWHGDWSTVPSTSCTRQEWRNLQVDQSRLPNRSSSASAAGSGDRKECSASGHETNPKAEKNDPFQLASNRSE